MLLKKHKSLVIFMLSFSIIVIIYLTSNIMQPKNFSYFIDTNNQNISKVKITNGNNGKCIDVNDKTKIKELVTLLNNRGYKKSSNQNDLIGYNFSYTFYSKDKKILEVVDHGDEVKINKVYYDVVNGNSNGIRTWIKKHSDILCTQLNNERILQ
ncbi:hypothetical protein [Clostridium sp. K25]|uniref:hypothetical protein n=1 Tax=Clostridium sp. K25 TaxID=1443109 RepID=UPI0006527A88|nr:hypothetical protein [Clostridium sp. K25]